MKKKGIFQPASSLKAKSKVVNAPAVCPTRAASLWLSVERCGFRRQDVSPGVIFKVGFRVE